jgi:hypothetical protein
MRIKRKMSCIPIILVGLLLSCSKPGAEYIGKWQNIKDPHDRFEITSNGDNLLVRQTKKDFFGKEHTSTVPATVHDGLLKIGEGSLFGGTLTYVKATDRITTAAMLGSDVEYERAK